jgi:hypothetical protein
MLPPRNIPRAAGCLESTPSRWKADLAQLGPSPEAHGGSSPNASLETTVTRRLNSTYELSWGRAAVQPASEVTTSAWRSCRPSRWTFIGYILAELDVHHDENVDRLPSFYPARRFRRRQGESTRLVPPARHTVTVAGRSVIPRAWSPLIARRTGSHESEPSHGKQRKVSPDLNIMLTECIELCASSITFRRSPIATKDHLDDGASPAIIYWV